MGKYIVKKSVIIKVFTDVDLQGTDLFIPRSEADPLEQVNCRSDDDEKQYCAD